MPQVREVLPRQLRLTGLWLLVINGVIGAGIFGLPAALAATAGGLAPWLLLAGGVLILPVILVFADLSSRFNATGGPVLYTSTAFGPFTGFQVGWAFYVARLTAFAANANLLVTTLGWFNPDLAEGHGRAIALSVLILALILINLVSTRAAVRSLGVLTAAKLLPLAALALAGLWLLPAAAHHLPTAQGTPNALAVGPALVLVIYAYVGFESGLVPAGEATSPGRDLPRALFLALGMAGMLYALVQVACTALVPDLAHSQRPVVQAGEALAGALGAGVIVAAVVASVGGNLLGAMYSTPRITYRLALDGYLPTVLAHVHPRHGVPHASIVLFGGVALALAVSGSFALLAVMSVLVRLGIYMLSALALPRLRHVHGDPVSGSHRMLIVFTLLFCAGLATQVDATSWLATGLLLGAGSLLYGVSRARAGSSSGTPPGG
ncbi:MAG: APC family permease [Pseudomonadales bacterium]|nr:APC family permease [Pseudomonadales bacterium]MCP5184916.1 APC family permease [Pseudomonadales bacterium]